MTTVNAERRQPLAAHHQEPEQRRVPVRVERHDPVDAGEGDGERVDHQAGAAQPLNRQIDARVAGVLPQRQPVQHHRERRPARRSRCTTRTVKNVVFRYGALACRMWSCCTRSACVHGYSCCIPSRIGSEQHRQQRNRPARRLEDPPEDAPRATRQVLNHHQRHRAERDAEEQHEGDQPGAEQRGPGSTTKPAAQPTQPERCRRRAPCARARRTLRPARCRSRPRQCASCAGSRASLAAGAGLSRSPRRSAGTSSMPAR